MNAILSRLTHRTGFQQEKAGEQIIAHIIRGSGYRFTLYLRDLWKAKRAPTVEEFVTVIRQRAQLVSQRVGFPVRVEFYDDLSFAVINILDPNAG